LIRIEEEEGGGGEGGGGEGGGGEGGEGGGGRGGRVKRNNGDSERDSRRAFQMRGRKGGRRG
jgi:hypothetical protein